MINLALDLASTIRHDGRGGVADDLATPTGLASWVHDRAEALGAWAPGFCAEGAALEQIVWLRAGVRALFAHAVRPGPPSPADAHRLLPVTEALDRINRAASWVPVTPVLDWPEDGEPVARTATATTPDPVTELTAALARATVDFLASPDRANLRACTAPRCVRYFLKGHGRQEFCKPSCSSRARVARHYQRHHQAPAAAPVTDQPADG